MASCVHRDSEAFYRSDSRQITSSKFSASFWGEKNNPSHMENKFGRNLLLTAVYYILCFHYSQNIFQLNNNCWFIKIYDISCEQIFHFYCCP